MYNACRPSAAKRNQQGVVQTLQKAFEVENKNNGQNCIAKRRLMALEANLSTITFGQNMHVQKVINLINFRVRQ